MLPQAKKPRNDREERLRTGHTMAREFAEENAGPTVPAPDTANDREQTSNPQSDGDEAGSGHESDDTEGEDTE